MGNRAVNKYLDDIRRTLLAWYRIVREPVFHACYAMRLGLPVKLLIRAAVPDTILIIGYYRKAVEI